MPIMPLLAKHVVPHLNFLEKLLFQTPLRPLVLIYEFKSYGFYFADQTFIIYMLEKLNLRLYLCNAC